MKLTHKDLEDATQENIITKDQAEKLWLFWLKKTDNTPTFILSHVMYYFGGLLAISAVTLFVTVAWDNMKGFPLLFIVSMLFLISTALTKSFLQKNLTLPAGIMATFTLALVPLAVYNLQVGLGFNPPKMTYNEFNMIVSWYWFPMEIITLLVGVLMLYQFRFPFLLFIISWVLWYMSMDLAPLFLHFSAYSFQQRTFFSIEFGLIVLLFAVYFDLQYEDEQDYSFWLYLSGALMFWSGISVFPNHSELAYFIYLVLNLIMILISVILDRRVFAIFGALGVLAYLSHITFTVFARIVAFPLVLVALGIFIILIAAKWSKVEKKMYLHLKPYIPRKILERMR